MKNYVLLKESHFKALTNDKSEKKELAVEKNLNVSNHTREIRYSQQKKPVIYSQAF